MHCCRCCCLRHTVCGEYSGPCWEKAGAVSHVRSCVLARYCGCLTGEGGWGDFSELLLQSAFLQLRDAVGVVTWAAQESGMHGMLHL